MPQASEAPGHANASAALAPADSSAFNRPELDVLRFCAFLGVFLNHTLGRWGPEKLTQLHMPVSWIPAVAAFVQAGNYCVDLFFMLSAYLITVLLLRERQQTGKLDIGRFYVRRALRIWPLYFLALMIFTFFVTFNPTGEFSPFFPYFLFFAGNWAFVSWGWPGSPANPLWTVSIEEQFYLLWPPIAAMLSRRGLLIVASTCIITANMARVMGLAYHESTQHMWGNTFTHLDALGIGILLAAILGDRMPAIHLKWRTLLILGGFGCLLIRGSEGGLRSSDMMNLQEVLLGYPAVAVGCTAILLGALGASVRLPRIQYLGKISFGLYVWHAACLALLKPLDTQYGGMRSLLWPGVGLLLTIYVAWVSYEWIERPFLKLKQRFSLVASRAA